MSSVTVATGICAAKADTKRQRIERFFSGNGGSYETAGVAANSTFRSGQTPYGPH
jgi:hypothetical protein